MEHMASGTDLAVMATSLVNQRTECSLSLCLWGGGGGKLKGSNTCKAENAVQISNPGSLQDLNLEIFNLQLKIYHKHFFKLTPSPTCYLYTKIKLAQVSALIINVQCIYKK